MRLLIILILSSAPVFGADTGIRVFTAAKTNMQSAVVTTRQVFTRDGQTNLVCTTKSRAGEMQIRIHRFYYQNILLADYVGLPDSSQFTAEPNSPYSVSLGLNAAGNPKSAFIGTKAGVVVDLFTYTNGMFFPLDSALIQRANAIGSDLKQLRVSPEESDREAQGPAERRKTK